MILDSLKNCNNYAQVHPRFQQAFDFLQSTDLNQLPLGKIELDGTNLVVNIVLAKGKTRDEAKMETHNQFIDIQVPLETTETMGWISGNMLKNPLDAYNSEKDITFFTDKATNFIEVLPMQFAVFFPEDGHQPGIFTGEYKKIIVKVRV